MIDEKITQLLKNREEICALYEEQYKHLIPKIPEDQLLAEPWTIGYRLRRIGRVTIASGEEYEEFSINSIGRVDRVWHHKIGFFLIDMFSQQQLRDMYKSNMTYGDFIKQKKLENSPAIQTHLQI